MQKNSESEKPSTAMNGIDGNAAGGEAASNNSDSKGEDGDVDKESGEHKPMTRRTVRQFLRKYFLEGQKLDLPVVAKHSSASSGNLVPCSGSSTNSSSNPCLQQQSEPEQPLHERYRKYIGLVLPAAFMQLIWWTLAIRYDFFSLYPTRYAMAVTMVFGATVAGATSEGGGAIAFPVMTLLLHIDSVVARDFSLMIQSCGMTSSAFAILWMRILVEWHSVIFCTIGSTFGIVLGLQFVDELFDGPTKKMLFVSIWFSFAIALFMLNRQHKRVAHLEIKDFCAWKATLLLLTGFIGGLCSAFSGSGVDICSFSILTLLFRVSEKIATPTSVLLMAANTLVGFFWRQLIQSDVSDEAWEYFAVSVPVVVVCGPLGAFLSSHCHRQVLAGTVYALEALALLGFLITLPPVRLLLIGAAIIVFSFFFFLGICQLGNWLDTGDSDKANGTTPSSIASFRRCIQLCWPSSCKRRPKVADAKAMAVEEGGEQPAERASVQSQSGLWTSAALQQHRQQQNGEENNAKQQKERKIP